MEVRVWLWLTWTFRFISDHLISVPFLLLPLLLLLLLVYFLVVSNLHLATDTSEFLMFLPSHNISSVGGPAHVRGYFWRLLSSPRTEAR